MDSEILAFLILIISTIVGILVMTIAENKGRGNEKLGFFLLGFFFNIIGLIIVLILEDKSTGRKGASTQNSNKYSEGTTGLICEVCGAGQSVSNTKCWKCGGKIIRKEDVVVKSSVKSNTPTPKINFCSNCGDKVDENARFCSSCGTQLVN